ncbi:hypothetical protein CPU12_10250 [Malaciobacter molluscorum LMG 25693]|uniref:Uncharacterized protein n=1 Tax=Malaciobacter molluscorum LMG 25693 TaxID=870501 RepID=A0A2G1DG03_9BACT|nr:hypothetical protein [Malaciobacter molluscorum]AXX91136.1 hypothetical protein AMOL_0096 [Malaciobacter molluscorum LMG 25693]PHO17419.1 hypothetical protein CPU12_10250 [Malaciobacter molluscorum LMG 25693]RXJ93740.1 hypothetical protein CRV00_09770 [Malaciobacter molluscorum]
MKYIKILLLILISITFNACTTSLNQESIDKSNNQQISQLLDELHKKDQKIEKLENEIEKLKEDAKK